MREPRKGRGVLGRVGLVRGGGGDEIWICQGLTVDGPGDWGGAVMPKFNGGEDENVRLK